MATMTTTTQKKNTMIPGMAYPTTLLALAMATSYPPPPVLLRSGRAPAGCSPGCSLQASGSVFTRLPCLMTFPYRRPWTDEDRRERTHNPPVAGLLSTPMDGIRQDVNPAHLTTLMAYVLRLHGYGRADPSLIRGECMAKYSFSMHPSR
jgi:hypothetical protein